MKPDPMIGRTLTADSGRQYTIGALIAYQGKKGCQDPRCRRAPGIDACHDWHCAKCDEPCSGYGHPNGCPT